MIYLALKGLEAVYPEDIIKNLSEIHDLIMLTITLFICLWLLF